MPHALTEHLLYARHRGGCPMYNRETKTQPLPLSWLVWNGRLSRNFPVTEEKQAFHFFLVICVEVWLLHGKSAISMHVMAGGREGTAHPDQTSGWLWATSCCASLASPSTLWVSRTPGSRTSWRRMEKCMETCLLTLLSPTFLQCPSLCHLLLNGTNTLAFSLLLYTKNHLSTRDMFTILHINFCNWHDNSAG